MVSDQDFPLSPPPADQVLEAERARIAVALEQHILESLHLVIAQIAAYEAAFGDQPGPKLAFNVLGSLLRQSIQQVRDLQTDLRLTLLESAGLIGALEALAAHELRLRRLNIQITARRKMPRPPLGTEIALYRAAQNAIWDAAAARATRVELSLSPEGESLWLVIADNRPPHGAKVAYSTSGAETLTPREIEVLRLLAQGLSNKEIGEKLELSLRTVKFHLDNVYSKLGVGTRTEALIAALRAGLFGG